MTPRKALAAVSLAAIALALLAIVAIVTPARAQSAPEEPKLDFNSPCGERATGKSPRDERPITGAFPNQRVNADGYWESGCTPPIPPKDCPDMPAPRWFANGAWCSPLQPTIHSGNLGQIRRINQADFRGGWRDYQCLQRSDGVRRWVPLRSRCR